MAQSALRGFANLSRYQQAAVQPQANVLDQFVQALNQGVSLAQLPQTLQAEAAKKQNDAILTQLNTALLQQKVYDAQHPDEVMAKKIKEQITLDNIKRQLPGAEAAPVGLTGQTIFTPGAITQEQQTLLNQRDAGVQAGGIPLELPTAPLGAPITPIAPNGIQTGFNYNPQVEAARNVAESAKEAAKQKAKYDAMGIPTRLIQDNDGNWLAVPTRQFGGVPNQATGLTYADTGENVTAPQKAAPQVKMIEKSDANGDLLERPATGGPWTYALTPDGKHFNVGVPNKFFDTESGMMTAPTKTPGGTAPTASPLLPTEQPPASPGGGFVPAEGTTPSAPKQVKSAKSGQQDAKTWETVLKQANPLMASSRSPLGVVATSDNRANRALVTLNNKDLTNEQAHFIISDIAGIYKGGSPTQSEQANAFYKTLYGKFQGALQYITGEPKNAVPELVRQQLIETVNDMKRTNLAVMQQNFQSLEAGHPELIAQHQKEWEDLKSKFSTGLESGMPKEKSKTVRVMNPDGSTGSIPEEDLSNALKAGYKKIE